MQDWNLQLIELVRRPDWGDLMHHITLLGSDECYFMLIALTYWCFHPAHGLRIACGLFISGGICETLRQVFQGPRPYWVHPDLSLSSDFGAVAVEKGFGMPSGHSQQAVVVWGRVMTLLRCPWLWVLLGIAIFLIGLSRIYLGVHYPYQVLSGWTIGLTILVLLICLEKPVVRWFMSCPQGRRIAWFWLLSLIIPATTLAVQWFHQWSLPDPGWAENARSVHPGGIPIAPFRLHIAVNDAAMLFGFCAGASLLWEQRLFHPVEGIMPKLCMSLIGLGGLSLIWYGGADFIPSSTEVIPYYSGLYIRGLIASLWMFWIWPTLWRRIYGRLSPVQSKLF
ncbi:phosphatase PAP2 family protein [Spongorhabdus nitratireducens]